LLSDHTSPLTKEHRQAEEAISHDTLELPGPGDTGSHGFSAEMLPDSIRFEGSPLEQLIDLPETPTKRFRPTDMRVEELLSPVRRVNKSVGEDVEMLVREIGNEIEPESMLQGINDDEDDQHLTEMAQKANVALGDMLEQEGLTGQETQLRVEVPQLDFALPNPPWRGPRNELPATEGTDTSFWAAFLEDLTKGLPTEYLWPIDSLKEREMQWRIFPPEEANVDTREEMEDSSFLVELLESIQLGHRIDYDNLCLPSYTSQFPRHAEAEEDELLVLEKLMATPPDAAFRTQQTSHTSNKTGLDSGLDVSLTNFNHNPPDAAIDWLVPLKRPAAGDPYLEAAINSRPNTCAALPMLDDNLAPVHRISTFMMGRGRSVKKRKTAPSKSTYFTTDSPPDATPPHPQQAIFAAQESSPKNISLNNPTSLSLPLPSHPISLLILHTLQKTHPSLIHALTSLFPSTTILERDCTQLKCILTRSNPTPSTLSSQAQDEPEIALSPSTAIILTTVPQITQTTLPSNSSGPTTSPLCARIAAIALKYERLYVLVSITANFSASLMASTATALTSLTAFCTSLSATSTASALFIPSADVKTLASHILALAARRCLDLPKIGTGITMLAEETTWEVFLRTAGLNTYAAQVVVSLVKDPDGQIDEERMDVSSESKSRYWHSDWLEGSMESEEKLWGLRKILHMEQVEREERFGEAMGGVRVLRRVGRALDGLWG
jgi:hypothetical protein